MDVKSVATSRSKRWRRSRTFALLAGLLVGLALAVSVVSLALASGSTFSDVSISNPYYQAITQLAYDGVIGGFPNGTFGPAALVTRQQFAKMVVIVGGYPVSESDVCPFTDVPVSGPDGLYPDNYVAVCAAHGITTGKTATTFDPGGNITRYQVVSMVVRAADDLKPGLLVTPPPSFQGTPSWQTDPIHGPNAARAEYNGLLAGLDLSMLSPNGYMTRGEVAQVLYNLTLALTPATTTTTSPSTTTTLVTTTTSSTSTTTTSTTVPLVGFEDLGGHLTAGPAVASWAAGRLDVFARGTTGELMRLDYNGFWDDTWQDLGGDVAADSRPAAVGGAAHVLDVCVLGSDGTLWYKYYNNAAWSTWTNVSGPITSSPAAASPPGSGILAVFARSASGTLLFNVFESGSWDGWNDLGGAVKAASDPAAVCWGPNRLDVFVRGADDALWHLYWTGLGWSAWESLGGALTSSPTVASTGVGLLDVFVRGPGNTLWQRSYNDVDNAWSAWKNLGGTAVASAPAALSWGTNRIDLFARGTTNTLWHKWWNGSTWLP